MQFSLLTTAKTNTDSMQLNVTNLTCERGEKILFRDLSFALNPGETLLLQGPNGSGKTTLLRVLAGFMPSLQGKIRLIGRDENISIGEYCHYVGHLNGIKNSFNVIENLDFFQGFFADIAASSSSFFSDYTIMSLDEALELFKLSHLRDIPAGYLSAGQKRRLSLVRLCLAARPIWLLDEPTIALDVASQDILAGVIQRHVSLGGMVIVATHIPLPGVSFNKDITLSHSPKVAGAERANTGATA